MQRTSLGLGAVAIGLSAILAGCGGGGGGSSSATPVIANPTGSSGTITPSAQGLLTSSTSYTVYTAATGGVTVVGIAPIGGGPPDAVNSWSLVTTGAVISYPDGTVQVSDALGNFDASQSTWATTNAANMAADPNDEPEVQVVVPAVSPESPLDVIVEAYAPPGAPTQTGSVLRSGLGMRSASGATAAPISELTSVSTLPHGTALFDTDSKQFHAIASDSDGQYIDLTAAGVKWSVGSCTGSSGAGKLTQDAKDAAKAVYSPPSAGTGCDLVIATINANGTTYSSTSNAFYFDKSAGVTVSGTLNDSTNKAVANGLVRFYGGGKEFYNGNLVAQVTNGAFSRSVPPNRTLSPVGGNIAVSGGRATASFFNLTPGTISVGGAGSTVAAATYTEGGSFANPYKPLPPLDRAIRDAWYLGNIAIEQFPFNRPLTGAPTAWTTCSVDAIINLQSNSSACAKVSSGEYYQQWFVSYVSASSWIFTEPTTIEGGRNVIAVQRVTSIPAGTIPTGISDSNTNGIVCSVAAPCFVYQAFYNPVSFNQSTGMTAIGSSNGAVTGTPAAAVAGAIAAADGVFSESGSTYPFSVKLVRNEYSVGHQTLGQPLYTHTLGFSYANAGPTTAASIANNWYNGAALLDGTLNLTRTPGTTATVAYTYTGTGTRSYFRGSTPAVTFGYSISNGVQNLDRTGGLTITLTGTTALDQTPVGSAIALTYNDPTKTATCPAGYPAPVQASTGARACGTVTNPNFTGLTSGFLAEFTVDGTYFVSLLTDPSIGANTANFHL